MLRDLERHTQKWKTTTQRPERHGVLGDLSPASPKMADTGEELRSTGWDFPGSPVAKTLLPTQEAQV